MVGNQHTSTGQARNLNVRLSQDLLSRLETAVAKDNEGRPKNVAPLSKADLVRAALEAWLDERERPSTPTR